MAKKQTPPDKDEKLSIADALLIEEVDDEVRAEKLRSLWQRFGSWLVAACVLIVVATIIHQVYQGYRVGQEEEASAILIEAQELADKGQYETAQTTLKPLMEKASDAAVLARIASARIAKQSKDDAATKKVLESLKKSNAQPVYSDLAFLEAHDFSDIQPESPFYSLAAEQKALALYRKGEVEEAKKLLSDLLLREDLTFSQTKRIEQLLQGS